MASSSTVPVTEGSVVTSRVFLSGTNWGQKHEHAVDQESSGFSFQIINEEQQESKKERKARRYDFPDLPLKQSIEFVPRPYSRLVFLLLELL